MSVTVLPPVTVSGAYDVSVTARNLTDGSRWSVELRWDEEAHEQVFRRRAVDGAWSISAPLALDDDPVLVFEVWAFGPYSCVLGATTGALTSGFGSCGNGMDGILVR